MENKEFYIRAITEIDPYNPIILLYEKQPYRLPMKVKEIRGKDAKDLLDILLKPVSYEIGLGSNTNS